MSEPLWSDDKIFKCLKKHGLSFFLMADGHREIITGSGAAAAMLEIRDDYAARLAELEQERDALRAIIAYIDKHAPLADDTCEEPGITLSEAARRAIEDERKESAP